MVVPDRRGEIGFVDLALLRFELGVEVTRNAATLGHISAAVDVFAADKLGSGDGGYGASVSVAAQLQWPVGTWRIGPRISFGLGAGEAEAPQVGSGVVAMAGVHAHTAGYVFVVDSVLVRNR